MPSPPRYACLARPLAFLYGLGVSVRSELFDRGVLRSEEYPIPILCVGNITVGGTGKTPHVEYLLALLVPHYRVAVLSRGYGRRTRGLIIAGPEDTAETIGDEPMQIHLKYPSVRLAIDGNRRRAMAYLMNLPEHERPEVVVMDDGYQHRYIKPSLSILLTDSRRPMWRDKLLPEGNLREPFSARQRADIVIVTKCAPEISPIQRRVTERSLGLYPYQHIFFSTIVYRSAKRLASMGELHPTRETGGGLPQGTPLYVVAGIASPRPLLEHLEEHYRVVDKGIYPDHHAFTQVDLDQIVARLRSLREGYPDVCCLCTEKDAVRLWGLRHMLAPDLLERLYYLPIETRILGQGSQLERIIRRAAHPRG